MKVGRMCAWGPMKRLYGSIRDFYKGVGLSGLEPYCGQPKQSSLNFIL